MKSKTLLLSIAAILLAQTVYLSSCKSCKKKEAETPVTTDTTSIPTPVHTIDLPHADTSLIPILSKVLEDALAASEKKDYNQLGALLVYRGPDSLKFGYDVFNAKNKFDKTVLRITSDVFNKWNANVESREYPRVFELGQPDGRSMPVLEVIFVSPKSVDRKFFGFLLIKDEWKIVDVTSYL